MRSIRLKIEREIVFDRCIKCGVEFGVTDEFNEQRRGDKQTFYCPNGHGQSYTESEADKLRRELNIAKQQIARIEDAANQRVVEANAARVAAERKLRQQTRRVTAGVCPCCNRTFQQLARHMASKHPEAKHG